jgi:hypothetical protein
MVLILHLLGSKDVPFLDAPAIFFYLKHLSVELIEEFTELTHRLDDSSKVGRHDPTGVDHSSRVIGRSYDRPTTVCEAGNDWFPQPVGYDTTHLTLDWV